MIPIKKLAGTPRIPAPDDAEVSRLLEQSCWSRIIAVGGEHTVGEKTYGEITYYHLNITRPKKAEGRTLEPVLRVFLAPDGSHATVWDGENHARSGEICNIIARKFYTGRQRLHTESAFAVGMKYLGCGETDNPTAYIDRQVEAKRSRRNAIHAKAERARMLDAFAKLPEYRLGVEDETFIRRNVISERFLFRFSKKVLADPITGLKRRTEFVFCATCGAIEETDPCAGDYRHGAHAVCPACGATATVYDIGRSKNTLWRRGVVEIAAAIDDYTLMLCDFTVAVDYTAIWLDNMRLPELKASRGTRRLIDIKTGDVWRYEPTASNPTGYNQVDYSPITSGTVADCTRVPYYSKGPKPWRDINGIWLMHGSDGLSLGELKYTDLPAVLSGFKGDAVAVNINFYNLAWIIRNYMQAPRVYEMMAKCGGVEYLGIHPSELSGMGINTDGKTPREVFGVDAKAARTLLAISNPQMYRRTRDAICAGIPAESASMLEVWFDHHDDGYKKLKHIALLPAKAKEYGYDMEIYRDYIRQAVELGYDLGDKYYEFPRDLEKAHTDATAAIALKNDRELQVKIEKRLPALAPYEYSNGRFVIRPAQSIVELALEADAQRNCVYKNYSRLYANGACVIAFVRRCDAPEKSYITVEINNEYKIVQARIAMNRLPDDDGKQFLVEYERKVLARLKNQSRKKKVRITA